MSKFLISFFSFFLFLVNLNFSKAFASPQYRGGAELLNENAYSIYFDTSLFEMSSHIDDSGKEYTKLDGSAYRLTESNFKLSYGINSHLEASLLARGRVVSSTDGNTTASNSGPESVGVEGKYSFAPVGNMKYALGLRYRKTLFTNTIYTQSQIPPTDQVILGDDGSEYGVDLYSTYNSGSWKLDLQGGYNSPPNDLSSEVVYKIQALYRFTQLSLMAGVDGIYSLGRDQYTDTPLQKPIMALGQSKLFNSLNREKVAPYLGGYYAFDKFQLGLIGSTVVSGKSTDKGNLYLMNINWNSSGVTEESVKINSFKEYHIDGSVLKVSARANFIKIDQGLSTDVEKGMKFDIYQTDYFGGNVLVATGVVYEVGSDWSVIKLVKKYKEIEIKPGFAARGY